MKPKQTHDCSLMITQNHRMYNLAIYHILDKNRYNELNDFHLLQPSLLRNQLLSHYIKNFDYNKDILPNEHLFFDIFIHLIKKLVLEINGN